MAVRLNFIVEGPTERRFVQDALRPHLAIQSIWVSVRCVETSRTSDRKYSGGIQNYAKAKEDIEDWTRQDRNADARFTTMFDLYALPDDFPGYDAAMRERDPYARVRVLEDALGDDINDRRFVPYIQLHEFEALVFADPTKLSGQLACTPAAIQTLVETAERGNPELIDDGSDTAPSKRIIREIPDYEYSKASAGPLAAQQIGLHVLRARCAHFGEWLDKLEALG